MSKRYELSFQLYSARAFPPLADQLRYLAELGYTNVESFGGLYAEADRFRALLQEYGLTVRSGHFDLPMIEADPPRAIDLAHSLGTEIVVAPWLDGPDRPKDAAGWKAFGERLARLDEVFASSGLAFAWHNHDFELLPLPDDTLPIEHLLDNSSVKLELDLAWVVRAGHDPVTCLERYSDRIAVVHLKDVAPAGQKLEEDGWAYPGDGILDWSSIWPAIRRTNAGLAILEHDRPTDWRDFAEKGAAAVRDELRG
ncbi:sugar phosphate isomerase/epimerase family protein [Inquilinus sp. CA228]|uniref:sugar phosphate isomerase/epimerase family protein n=1 Tax=Inquilinus sp. CA228 TaxID=3455609 RepID=UPI003F8D1673